MIKIKFWENYDACFVYIGSLYVYTIESYICQVLVIRSSYACRFNYQSSKCDMESDIQES